MKEQMREYLENRINELKNSSDTIRFCSVEIKIGKISELEKALEHLNSLEDNK